MAARWPWSASSRCCGVSGGSSASSSPETARSGAIAVISVASDSSSQAHGQRTKDKGQRTKKRKRLATKTAQRRFIRDKFSLVSQSVQFCSVQFSQGPKNPKESPGDVILLDSWLIHEPPHTGCFFGQGCHFVTRIQYNCMAPLPVAGLHAAAAAADGAESSGVISSSACFQSRLVSTPAPTTARSSRRSVPTTAC